jgi:hypothetical protein
MSKQADTDAALGAIIAVVVVVLSGFAWCILLRACGVIE